MVIFPIIGFVFCMIQRTLIKRKISGKRQVAALCLDSKIDWGSNIVFFKRSTWRLDGWPLPLQGRSVDTPLRKAGDSATAYVGEDGSVVLPCEVSYCRILRALQWAFVILALLVLATGY